LFFALYSKIRIAYERLEKYRKEGNGPEVAANMCGIELTQAADVSLFQFESLEHSKFLFSSFL